MVSDIFASYEQGIKELKARLGEDRVHCREVLAYEQRLLDNTARSKRYGDTEAQRAERAEIIDALNSLALECLGTSFTELCGLPTYVRGTPGELQVYEQCYLKQVRDACSKLYTEGMEQIPAPLTDVVVMLKAVETPPREIKTDIPPTQRMAEESRLEGRIADKEPRSLKKEEARSSTMPPSLPVPLSVAFQRHRHLVILGDPGSGKTTLLQFVALCFATDGMAREELRLHEPRMPVRAELRGYSGKESLGELLVKAVAQVGKFDVISDRESQGIARVLLKRWLDEGRLIVLLDGLDEVPEAQRVAVSEAIASFVRADKGRSCRTVVTTRIAGYRATRQFGEPFGCYTICPFSGPDDALPYIAGWLKVINGRTKEEIKTQSHALLERMEQQPSLKPVIGNPLLLRLAVALYAEHNEVVQDRAELYRRYIDEVLIARERSRGAQNARWNRQQIGSALEAIAWALQTENQKTMTELVRVPEEVTSVEDGEALIGYLRERLGLLASYGYERGEVIAFRHSTFREFFVAQRLARVWKEDPEQIWQFLRSRLHHPDWREPILLLTTMLESKDSSALVERILNAKTLYECELSRDLMLAGECLKSGASLEPELRCTVIGELLRLYLDCRERVEGGFDWPALARSVIQPVGEILESLEGDDHAYLATLLLTMAKGEVQRTGARAVAADLTLAGRTLVLWSLELFPALFHVFEGFDIRRLVYGLRKRREKEGLLQSQEIEESDLAVALRVLREGLQEFLRYLVAPVHIPQYVRGQSESERNFRRRMAIKALGELRVRTPAVTPCLLSALEDTVTRGVAAEALGKVGQGTPEVVMALIDTQRRPPHVYGWDREVESIVEALGLLGQRYSEVTELLLSIVKSSGAEANIRYAVTQALCKVAETNTCAMAFVLDDWRRIHDAQWDSAAWAAIEEDVREGLRDGRKLFNSAAPEVIRYLLDAIWSWGFVPADTSASEFLSNVAGSTPLVQCKMVDRDGRIHYRALDLTEELFDILLQRASHHVAGNFAVHLLSIWGINRPDLIVRLIETVQKADAWVLASDLEGLLSARIQEDQLLENNQRLGGIAASSRQPVDQSTIDRLRQSITCLRSPDKALRAAELQRWLISARRASQSEFTLRYIPTMIEQTKLSVLHSAYHSVYNRIWSANEGAWGGPPLDLDPYVVAALACFRGWDLFSLPYATDEEIREEILGGSRFALSMLHARDRRSMEVLSSVINRELAEFFGTGLKEAAEKDLERHKDLELEWKQPAWLDRRRPNFRERSAAAYALAELTSAYPDAQEVLVSKLKPQFWGRGEYLETEFQEHLIRALGSVKSANRGFVAALLDIVIHHDREIYWAGSHALSRLSDPTPKAVALLCDKYQDLGQAEYYLARSRALKSLSTVKPYTPRIVDLFLKALKEKNVETRNAAAEALGDVSEADPRLVKALLAALRRTSNAAGALGNLAGQVASASGGLRNLGKIATALRRVVHQEPNLRSGVAWSGRDARDIAYDALARVAREITGLEVKRAPAHLSPPGFGGNSPVIRKFLQVSVVLSVLVSATLGLVSNIVAAYLQERYHLVSDPVRLAVVVIIFLVSLAVSIGLSWRGLR